MNPAIDDHDERIANEEREEYARIYYLFLATMVAATVLQLIFARVIWVFLPAIIGGGGSLAYFTWRFVREGLFTRRVITDERLVREKILIKSRCLLFCFYVYVLGALPLLFVDVPPLGMAGFMLTWFIPAVVGVVRLAKRGSYAPGSENTAKSRYAQLKKNSAISAVFFGVFMSLYNGLFLGSGGDLPSMVLNLSLDAVIHGVLFGFGIYFMMKFIDKRSEKHANRRVKSAEEESEATDEE